MSTAYTPYVEAFTLYADKDGHPNVEFHVDDELIRSTFAGDPDRTAILIRLGDVEAPSISSHRSEVRVDSDRRVADLDQAIRTLIAVRDELRRMEATHV